MSPFQSRVSGTTARTAVMDLTNPHCVNNLMQLLKLSDDDERQERRLSTSSSSTISSTSATGSDRRMMSSRQQTEDCCRFCKRNGETLEVRSSHVLHDSSGRVTCPFLRGYVCELCGATGDKAHTRSYCPIARVARSLGTGAPHEYVYHNAVQYLRLSKRKSHEPRYRRPDSGRGSR